MILSHWSTENTLALHEMTSHNLKVRVWYVHRISKVEEGTYRRSRKWDDTKLQNPKIINKYEKNMAQKLNETDSSPGIELEWDNLKTVTNDVAYDDAGTKKKNTKMLDDLMKITEKQLKQRMKQERNV